MFEAKEEIAHTIKEELTKSMSGYGFIILHALVTDIEPLPIKTMMIPASGRRLLSQCATQGNSEGPVTARRPAMAPESEAFQQQESNQHQQWRLQKGSPITVVHCQHLASLKPTTSRPLDGALQRGSLEPRS